MTLIVSHANRAGFCQVSDRVNSIGQSVVRRNSNKCLILLARDGIISIGVTGHALFRGEETDHVLADVVTGGVRHRSLTEFIGNSAQPFVTSIHAAQGRMIRFLENVKAESHLFDLQICCVGFREFRGKLLPHLTVIDAIGDSVSVFGTRPLPLLVGSSFVWHLSGDYDKARPDITLQMLREVHAWEQKALDDGQQVLLVSALGQFSSSFPNAIGPSALSVLGKIRSREIIVQFHDSENRRNSGYMASLVGTDTPYYSPWVIAPFVAHPPQQWLGVPMNLAIGNWTVQFSGDPNAAGHVNLGFRDRR